ncbi:MAG TPA: hypothetical protein DCW68_06290 [Rhodospirillaceae bacterium]|nr:MAG: hypothetical protein A2018_03930 [Alphaproteobacteria bacterium GWF2_58_20]HAU29699.1 hypothetical protein [Rhodospirillaceae bacterium]
MKRYLPYLLSASFSLLPLPLVFSGQASPFDVMAFYWVELIAIGMATIVRMGIMAASNLAKRRWAKAAEAIAGLLFMPIHFGFFIIMMCFPIGSFLPEGTPMRILDNPLVPFEMVVYHANLSFALPLALAWQGADLFFSFLLPKRYKETGGDSGPAFAYGQLFVLFVASLFGLMLAMRTNERIWGVIVLVGLKTVFSLGAISIRENKKAGH